MYRLTSESSYQSANFADMLQIEDRSRVIHSIAQVGSIDQDRADAMLTELAPHINETAVNYPDFENGGWRLLAMYNNSGDPHDTTVAEGIDVRPTSVLEEMPTVQEVIEGFFPPNNIVLARLARLRPGGRLMEHVDYTELDADNPRLRFHLPLVTEPEAVFVTSGHRVHMGTGNLWVVNPRGAHGVVHGGERDRLHLIVDAAVDSSLKVEDPWLDHRFVERLPQMDEQDVDDFTRKLTALIESGACKQAVSEGHDLFYRRQLPSRYSTHQVIARAFEMAGDATKAIQWHDKHDIFMGGGFKHD